MLAFACIHTHDVNYKKKIQTCVRKIRFYVVFGSKRKKSHIHANIFMLYHISIFMHISCYVSIFMQI